MWRDTCRSVEFFSPSTLSTTCAPPSEICPLASPHARASGHARGWEHAALSACAAQAEATHTLHPACVCMQTATRLARAGRGEGGPGSSRGGERRGRSSLPAPLPVPPPLLPPRHTHTGPPHSLFDHATEKSRRVKRIPPHLTLVPVPTSPHPRPSARNGHGVLKGKGSAGK
eukprot:3318950-Rhodomonas_salina.1